MPLEGEAKEKQLRKKERRRNRKAAENHGSQPVPSSSSSSAAAFTAAAAAASGGPGRHPFCCCCLHRGTTAAAAAAVEQQWAGVPPPHCCCSLPWPRWEGWGGSRALLLSPLGMAEPPPRTVCSAYRSASGAMEVHWRLCGPLSGSVLNDFGSDIMMHLGLLQAQLGTTESMPSPKSKAPERNSLKPSPVQHGVSSTAVGARPAHTSLSDMQTCTSMNHTLK